MQEVEEGKYLTKDDEITGYGLSGPIESNKNRILATTGLEMGDSGLVLLPFETVSLQLWALITLQFHLSESKTPLETDTV